MEFKPLAHKDIEPIFDEAVSLYDRLYGIDLSYLDFAISDIPLDTLGRPCRTVTAEEFGGCYLHSGIIVFNRHFEKAVNHYYGYCDREIYQHTLERVVAHEMAHAVWRLHSDDDFRQNILNRAETEGFTTEYLDSLDPSYDKYREEMFCEYLAGTIAGLLGRE